MINHSKKLWDVKESDQNISFKHLSLQFLKGGAISFVFGIALEQITPGPIMISAAFVGYKLAGLSGAIISTIAIFSPPALMKIFLFLHLLKI